MPTGPIKGTQIKDGRYYRVQSLPGNKKKWHPLTRVSEGLPAFYRAYADNLGRDSAGDELPYVIAEWQRDVMAKRAPKTQVDDLRRSNDVATRLSDFRASEVETPDCYEFLKAYEGTPRTYDAYRSLLYSVFQYCELRGWRRSGTNPVTAISTKGYKPRDRYITDSELRRIKVGALYGANGRRTPTGITMVCLIETLYLTGADVGVLVRLLEQRDPMRPNEPHLRPDGIYLRRDKTDGTSVPVIVGWTPRLRAAIDRQLRNKRERNEGRPASKRVDTGHVFTRMNGQPMNYDAASEAWSDAVKRSGVLPCMMRDLRAKAATDKGTRDGIKAANDLLDHTTETQTADYIRRKQARRTTAVR